MTDDFGAVPDTGVTGVRLRGSLDLAEIADLVLDAAVPGLGDAAAVFAIDRLLRGAEPRIAGATDSVTVRRLGTRIGRGDRGQVTQEIFPVGEVIALPPESPYTRCARGESLVFAPPGSPVLEPCDCGSGQTQVGCSSVLAVPAVSGGQVVGFLAVARTPGAPEFTNADVAAVSELAAGVGAGIANAVAMLRQRTIADTLQRTLLVAEPEVPPGIEAAARCLPASGQAVGGDWYDMIALPGGRSGIIVGDVMGHGPEAAAVMAHLRSAAHALARLDPEPADFLAQLDRSTAMLREPTLATCVYAVIDPADGSCTLATAGHLPPALAMPGGATHVPDLPSGPSLGLGSAAYGQARIKLRPGAILALYTDGLVETRTRSFDQGIRALRAILSRHDGTLEEACDTLIAELSQRYEDDVTVVLARCPGMVA